ncbi:monooxygenase FAD-binding protein [Rhexocercosporidium sp. MPI-PUGE-AT-0058]|nr:monooxygenase FAD-binding protein [Rhexocercosporidium sp. MPI-PUGE-AT-0058]
MSPPAITTPSPRVLIIGLGISGPLLALLLHAKGYTPTILEKVSHLGDAGASMMLFPNGLKAISSISLDLAEEITRLSADLEILVDINSNGDVIGGSELPRGWKEEWGMPGVGVRRTELNLLLRERVLQAGIEVVEGWKLSDIVCDADKTVTAISTTGARRTGEFLVGCDGIHSKTREVVLRSHGVNEVKEPVFTGLIQTAGMSPTPEGLRGVAGMRNWYGPDTHVIAYPVSEKPHTTSWAITTRSETEEIETWKALSPSALAGVRNELLRRFEGWDENMREMIGNAERVIRYGLFDRGQLEGRFWVGNEEVGMGRCVLIGDAAHPTSPHLGQGGNQAAEDAYWLARLLPDVRGCDGGKLEGEVLREAFVKFARGREVRTGVLVRGARAVGERRVVSKEECRERDEMLRKGWEDHEAVEEKWKGLLREPFLM